jgi:hypothetical protein
MANINDFKGIPPITWSFIVAMMISTIIPGLLLVFLFREDLFMTVETVKLLFLSMGITMPVWLCNTLFFAFAIDEETVNKNDDEARNYLQLTGLIGAFISIPTLFIPALVKMFVDISSNIAFYIGLGIEIAIIIAFIVSMNKDKKKSRK